MTETAEVTPTGGIRFTAASRPMRRFSNVQTVKNLAGGVNFQPIPLPATGWVRKIGMEFIATFAATTPTLFGGDAPFNLISRVTLTDATGQPITQPISGYNLYLVNKYFGTGTTKFGQPNAKSNPQIGPDYDYSVSGGTATARFRLDLDLEVDAGTGYGSIPNLDANASLMLYIEAAAASVAFAGETPTDASVDVRVDQWYWAPVGGTIGGVSAQTSPPGAGDYLETRYETMTVSAQAENVVPVNNRGGLVRGFICVSRAAGVRTAFTPNTDIGVVYDNNAIDEGIRLETVQDQLRRQYGYIGDDIGAANGAYAPLTAGTVPGLEDGVVVYNFAGMSSTRDTWLNTRVGTLLQFKMTPGASATQLEVIPQLMQVKDPAAFYGG